MKFTQDTVATGMTNKHEVLSFVLVENVNEETGDAEFHAMQFSAYAVMVEGGGPVDAIIGVGDTKNEAIMLLLEKLQAIEYANTDDYAGDIDD